MDPVRECRAEDLFAAAVSLPEEERQLFLAKMCEDDAELLARVCSLLRAHADSALLFETTPLQEKLRAAMVSVMDAASGDTPQRGPPAPEAPQSGRSGQRLSHYRLEEKVGHGGMGEVYRARDLHLPRDVAVKILPAGALADDQIRRRFRKEAEALSQLKHPHIATIHDYDSQDGVDFLVMEYVEGGTLPTDGDGDHRERAERRCMHRHTSLHGTGAVAR